MRPTHRGDTRASPRSCGPSSPTAVVLSASGHSPAGMQPQSPHNACPIPLCRCAPGRDVPPEQPSRLGPVRCHGLITPASRRNRGAAVAAQPPPHAASADPDPAPRSPATARPPQPILEHPRHPPAPHPHPPPPAARCPYAHEKERERRRDPRRFEYASLPCPDTAAGRTCPRGDGCGATHGLLEYWWARGAAGPRPVERALRCSAACARPAVPPRPRPLHQHPPHPLPLPPPPSGGLPIRQAAPRPLQEPDVQERRSLPAATLLLCA